MPGALAVVGVAGVATPELLLVWAGWALEGGRSGAGGVVAVLLAEGAVKEAGGEAGGCFTTKWMLCGPGVSSVSCR